MTCVRKRLFSTQYKVIAHHMSSDIGVQKVYINKKQRTPISL